MSCIMRKPVFQPDVTQIQKQARSLKCQFYEEEELYYLCSENKGAASLFPHRQKSIFLMMRFILYLTM